MLAPIDTADITMKCSHALLASLALVFSTQTTAEITLENTPLVKGFVWSCSDKKLREIMEASMPPNFNLFDCALQTSDWELWSSGQEMAMTENYLVGSSIAKVEDFGDGELFALMKKTYGGQFEQLLAQNEYLLESNSLEVDAQLSLTTDQPVGLYTGGITPLGQWESSDSAYSFAVLLSSISGEGEAQEVVNQIAVTSITDKKSDIVIQYYYRNYSGQADVKRAKEVTTQWLNMNR